MLILISYVLNSINAEQVGHLGHRGQRGPFPPELHPEKSFGVTFLLSVNADGGGQIQLTPKHTEEEPIPCFCFVWVVLMSH